MTSNQGVVDDMNDTVESRRTLENVLMFIASQLDERNRPEGIIDSGLHEAGDASELTMNTITGKRPTPDHTDLPNGVRGIVD